MRRFFFNYNIVPCFVFVDEDLSNIYTLSTPVCSEGSTDLNLKL